MVLADFHLHTTFSDGKLTPRQLVDLYGQCGFSAIAITDHLCEPDTTLGWFARKLDRTLLVENFNRYLSEIHHEAIRAKKLYGMTVIPGLEITKNSFSHINSAHILGLGINRFIDPSQDVVSVIRDIKLQGGLAIAAHPVSTRKVEAQTFHLWERRDELFQEFDAWEVASGPHLFNEVLESGLPMIANSDLHNIHQINSWKTLINSRNNQTDILNAIRHQDLDFKFWKAPVAELKHHFQGSIYATNTPLSATH